MVPHTEHSDVGSQRLPAWNRRPPGRLGQHGVFKRVTHTLEDQLETELDLPPGNAGGADHSELRGVGCQVGFAK